jgi:hypothetical protein
MVEMECAKNLVLLVWEEIRQPNLEGTINLVDILWPCFRQQLVSALEGLVNVKNDIVHFLRLGLRLLGRATLCLVSSSRGWGGGLLLYCFTFLGLISPLRANLAEVICAQQLINSSSDSGNSPSSKTIPTLFAFSPQITSLHLSQARRTAM